MSERRLFLRSIKSRRERYEVRGDAGLAFDFDTISEGVQISSQEGCKLNDALVNKNWTRETEKIE